MPFHLHGCMSYFSTRLPTQEEEEDPSIPWITFTSDAGRSTLRQLPRPFRGCRCKRDDHEYLHDPKCLLYRDVCRLVPKEILPGLLKVSLILALTARISSLDQAAPGVPGT